MDINPDQLILPETEPYLETNNKRRKSISTIETDEQQEGWLNFVTKVNNIIVFSLF